MGKSNVFFLVASLAVCVLIVRDAPRLFAPNIFLSESETEQQFAQSISCSKYGQLPLDELFTSYVVQPGDSLRLIARRELGDEELIDGIVHNNSDLYPDIKNRSAYAFLERGWTLRLPVQSLGAIHGMLVHTAGLVLSADGHTVRFTSEPNASGIGVWTVDPGVQFPGREILKKGTCVSMLLEYRDYDSKIIRVQKQ